MEGVICGNNWQANGRRCGVRLASAPILTVRNGLYTLVVIGVLAGLAGIMKLLEAEAAPSEAFA